MTAPDFITGNPTTLTDARVHTGWTIGGGFEFGVANGWSGKLEYLHVDLGTQNYFRDAQPRERVGRVSSRFATSRARM